MWIVARPFMGRKALRGMNTRATVVDMKLPVGKIIAIVIFLLLALGGAGILVGYIEASAGRESLVAAVRAIQAKDFSAAQTALSATARHMQVAHVAFAGVGWMRPIPKIGAMARSASDVTYAASQVAGALRDAVRVADTFDRMIADLRRVKPSADLSLSGLTAADRARVGSALVRASVVVRQGNERIRLARGRLQRMPPDVGIKGLNDARSVLLTTLHELETRLKPLSLATLLAPRLAGFPEKTTSLVLFLNNTELRPGGGFIGTYGMVDTYAGSLARVLTKDAYHLDRAAKHTGVVPPEPMAKYLELKEWFFRDSNWSPDFSQSAKTTLDFFNQESKIVSGQAPPITFVFGITPDVIGALLKVVGPITVDTSTFTSANIADELEYQVEKGFKAKGVPFEQRKEILARFADILMTRLSALPFTELQKIVWLIEDKAKEKQFMVYSGEPELEAMLDDLGVSGRVPDAPGDFLMLVDANLGALKTDPVVRRTMRYTISRNEYGTFADVAVKYQHTGARSWKIASYRSYTRLYVPRGSKLETIRYYNSRDAARVGCDPRRDRTCFKTAKDITSGDDLDKTFFGALVTVPPQTETTVVWRYRLREDVLQKNPYRLTVLRPLGSGIIDLTTTLDLGKKITAAEPGEDPRAFGDSVYEFEGNLWHDKEFVIRF